MLNWSTAPMRLIRFSDPPIRQAYVDLVIPVGNGLDSKMGQWDNILGYESSDA